MLEAARLCLDYCNDPEGAISILSAAQRWLPALQLALRYSRKDLFEEVIITFGFFLIFAFVFVFRLPLCYVQNHSSVLPVNLLLNLFNLLLLF